MQVDQVSSGSITFLQQSACLEQIDSKKQRADSTASDVQNLGDTLAALNLNDANIGTDCNHDSNEKTSPIVSSHRPRRAVTLRGSSEKRFSTRGGHSLSASQPADLSPRTLHRVGSAIVNTSGPSRKNSSGSSSSDVTSNDEKEVSTKKVAEWEPLSTIPAITNFFIAIGKGDWIKQDPTGKPTIAPKSFSNLFTRDVTHRRQAKAAYESVLDYLQENLEQKELKNKVYSEIVCAILAMQKRDYRNILGHYAQLKQRCDKIKETAITSLVGEMQDKCTQLLALISKKELKLHPKHSGKTSYSSQCPNLQRYAKTSENIRDFVFFVVSQGELPEERALRYETITLIAKKAFEENNFHFFVPTLRALLEALGFEETSDESESSKSEKGSFTKMILTRRYMDPETLRYLQEMSVYVLPKTNYQGYRNLVSSKSKASIIPYLAPHLRAFENNEAAINSNSQAFPTLDLQIKYIDLLLQSKETLFQEILNLIARRFVLEQEKAKRKDSSTNVMNTDNNNNNAVSQTSYQEESYPPEMRDLDDHITVAKEIYNYALMDALELEDMLFVRQQISQSGQEKVPGPIREQLFEAKYIQLEQAIQQLSLFYVRSKEKLKTDSAVVSLPTQSKQDQPTPYRTRRLKVLALLYYEKKCFDLHKKRTLDSTLLQLERCAFSNGNESYDASNEKKSKYENELTIQEKYHLANKVKKYQFMSSFELEVLLKRVVESTLIVVSENKDMNRSVRSSISNESMLTTRRSDAERRTQILNDLIHSLKQKTKKEKLASLLYVMKEDLAKRIAKIKESSQKCVDEREIYLKTMRKWISRAKKKQEITKLRSDDEITPRVLAVLQWDEKKPQSSDVIQTKLVEINSIENNDYLPSLHKELFFPD